MMKTFAIVAGTSVTTALIVSAIFLAMVPDAHPPAAPTAPSEDARVERLEKRLADVEAELTRMRRAPGASPRVAGIEPKAAVAKIRDDQKAAEEVVLGVLDSGDPAVANKVQDVVRDQLEIAREERFQERIKLRQQRISERVSKLADDHQLDGSARKKLDALLVQEHSKRMLLVRDARENMRWEEAREKMREDRAQTDAEVEKVLEGDDAALEEYREWRAQTNWGPGGRRGGRPQAGSDTKRPAPRPRQ